MLFEGMGLPKDEAKAVPLFQKAADQGLAEAQGLLGTLYLEGRVVRRDRQKGCALLRAAVQQGYKDAVNPYNDLCVSR